MDSALINGAWVPVILAAAGLLVIALFVEAKIAEGLLADARENAAADRADYYVDLAKEVA